MIVMFHPPAIAASRHAGESDLQSEFGAANWTATFRPLKRKLREHEKGPKTRRLYLQMELQSILRTRMIDECAAQAPVGEGVEAADAALAGGEVGAVEGVLVVDAAAAAVAGVAQFVEEVEVVEHVMGLRFGTSQLTYNNNV